MPDHNYFANLIWQIADLLRGPYRPPQYERVMLPMTVLRRFDCVLAPSKEKVLKEFERRKGGKLSDEALDKVLNNAAGERFHNHSPLDFVKLKGDPDHIEGHLVSYIKGFSANARRIFDFFEFENEIERMREANILYLVVSKFCDVDLHPSVVRNEQMGLIFENLIRRFNELANETAGDHFTPREVIRLMVNILFITDDELLATPGTGRKLLDPACGTGGMLAEPQNYLRVETDLGPKILAYGRDPNFPGWPDTLQRDYANPELQAARIDELVTIAEKCDGVRCDMAMLVLPEIFERTWGLRPEPFWPKATAAHSGITTASMSRRRFWKAPAQQWRANMCWRPTHPANSTPSA